MYSVDYHSQNVFLKYLNEVLTDSEFEGMDKEQYSKFLENRIKEFINSNKGNKNISDQLYRAIMVLENPNHPRLLFEFFKKYGRVLKNYHKCMIEF